MICPKCGKEMKDDNLLCEYCGEEVKFVPLFDAEIENQIDETINNIIKNLNATDHSEPIDEKEDNDSKVEAKEKLYQGMAITVLGIVCALVALWFIFRLVFNSNTSASFQYQYNKAVEYMEDEDFDNAIKYFEHALKIEPENIDARFYLGDLYIKTGQYQSGVMALEEMLKLNIADKARIYNSLLEAVLEKKDYKKVANILNACPYDDIIEKYADYSALLPMFNYEEGVYSDRLLVELTNVNPNGIIYYTLDGSKPTTNSQVYSSPIAIESGDYTIKAMFVNLYGCASDIITKNYYISLSHPREPEVVLDTGTYHEPMLIEVFHDKTTKIYYTMDGTIPNERSIRYTEPFEMPYGTSNMSFVAINENGLRSEIVSRTYQLDVSPAISDDIAVQILINHLIVEGVLADKTGKPKEKNGVNEYFIRTYITQDDRYYYIIDEYYYDEYNRETKTNNTYAIDAKDGSTYKAVKTGESRYNLKKI